MQRTKKKVQQSKPNHLVARRLSSQAAPPGTTPPPVARARSRPTPRVCAIHVPFPAPGERRFAGARSPSGKERSQQPATLPSPRRTAAGGGHRWRLEIPEELRLPSPTPSPGERRGLASEADRGAGGGGPWGGARRRRESILQPFRLLARGARGWRIGRGAAPGGNPPAAPEVRDKYPPPGSLRGRGVWTCPGRAGTCVSRRGWRRAQSALQSRQHSGKQPGPGTGGWGATACGWAAGAARPGC